MPRFIRARFPLIPSTLRGFIRGSDLIGWNDVLEISQTVNPPAAVSGRLSLIFRGGDKLNGAPISFNGDTLQWNSERLGQIGFPVDSLVGILQNGYAGPDLDQARTDDVVRLANGDTMHGIINAIAPAGVTIADRRCDADARLGFDQRRSVRHGGGESGSVAAANVPSAVGGG